MPSPFKRRSGAIKPMSQAELDASLAELEARANERSGVYIYRKHPGEEWSVNIAGETGVHRPEGVDSGGMSKEEAERYANSLASDWGMSYLGER